MVAPGIGLSWGEGVLRYKDQDYPFTFNATGLFRDVDSKIAAAELSGSVFELKRVEDFSGNYKKAASKDSASGAGTRATMKNQKGVVVNLVSDSLKGASLRSRVRAWISSSKSRNPEVMRRADE